LRIRHVLITPVRTSGVVTVIALWRHDMVAL